jgi:hypothetical protein
MLSNMYIGYIAESLPLPAPSDKKSGFSPSKIRDSLIDSSGWIVLYA